MTTKFGEPLAAPQTTQMADMPPLEVVTEGIPQQERVEIAPEARGWHRTWAWALAGVLGLLLLVAGVLAFMQYRSTGDADLTVVPPVGSDAGEPASESVPSGLLEGPPRPYIQGMSIPAIPSIADISISIPAISVAPFPQISIEEIPDIAIPDIAIPQISIADIPGM